MHLSDFVITSIEPNIHHDLTIVEKWWTLSNQMTEYVCIDPHRKQDWDSGYMSGIS